VIFLQKEQRTE
jgi:hypothetical protein